MGVPVNSRILDEWRKSMKTENRKIQQVFWPDGACLFSSDEIRLEMVPVDMGDRKELWISELRKFPAGVIGHEWRQVCLHNPRYAESIRWEDEG